MDFTKLLINTSMSVSGPLSPPLIPFLPPSPLQMVKESLNEKARENRKHMAFQVARDVIDQKKVSTSQTGQGCCHILCGIDRGTKETGY